MGEKIKVLPSTVRKMCQLDLGKRYNGPGSHVHGYPAQHRACQTPSEERDCLPPFPPVAFLEGSVPTECFGAASIRMFVCPLNS